MKLLGINQDNVELWIIAAIDKIKDYKSMSHLINHNGYNPYDIYFSRLQKCVEQLGNGIEVADLQY